MEQYIKLNWLYLTKFNMFYSSIHALKSFISGNMVLLLISSLNSFLIQSIITYNIEVLNLPTKV